MAAGLENRLFKNILKLLSGEGIGRAIGFMALPVVTRLYTSSDFGMLAVFSSLCALFYPFCTFKYTVAIPLHPNESVGINALAACLVILAVNTAILGTALFLYHLQILSLFSSEAIDSFWYYIPVAFLLFGTADALSYYATRYRAFSVIAKVTVVQKAVGGLTKIILGLLHFNVVGLLIGNILAESGGLTLYIRTFGNRLKENISKVTIGKIRFVLKRYIAFPLYRVPSSILQNASGSIPILYFAWQYGTVVTGQISLALTMLSVPVGVVCTSVGKAFYGEIASLGRKNSQEIATITLMIMIRLLAIGIVAFTLIIALGPGMFRTFFGPEWAQSGIYARYLCVYLIFRLVYSPISDGIFNVFEEQKLLFRIEVSRIAIVTFSLVVSYFCTFSVTDTIAGYSIALTVQYIISIIFVFYILRKRS